MQRPLQSVEKVCNMQTFSHICGKIEQGDRNAGTRENGSRRNRDRRNR